MIQEHPALLNGRTASCTCGKSMPSPEAAAQPFFAYRGPGTTDEQCSVCGYLQTAHEYEERRRYPDPVAATLDHTFAPRLAGFETDSFYCADTNAHPEGLD